jgi:hypothetical protein
LVVVDVDELDVEVELEVVLVVEPELPPQAPSTSDRPVIAEIANSLTPAALERGWLVRTAVSCRLVSSFH